MIKKIVILFLAACFTAWTEVRAESAFLFQTEAVDMQNVAQTKEEVQSENLMWFRRNGFASGYGFGQKPASVSVNIPSSGTYYVWVYYQANAVRRKTFSVLLDGKELVFCWKPYGDSLENSADIYRGREMNEKGMIWTYEPVSLDAGDHELLLSAHPNPPEGKWASGGHPPLVESILITNDPTYVPAER